MKVAYSARARRDLEAIGDYIARDNPSRALTFVTEMREACDGLARFPRRYLMAERYADSGIRQRVFGAYPIFYHVGEEAVTVLHIAHRSQEI